jgi:hypothetical protein|tara:strand:+ start:351 stop:1088 length:738 start_codon:yes stop_codon:yes gene_type:complete
MEIKYSKKLFYKEWAYKVRLKMPTGYNQYTKTLLKYARDKTVKNKLKSLMKDIRDPNSSGHQYLLEYGTEEQLQQMYDWIFWGRKNAIMQYGRINEYWRIITYYTNRYDLVEDMVKKFTTLVEYVEQPSNEAETEMMKNKKNTTIVERLPYNKYRYRCEIDYWQQHDEKICERFIRWSEPYDKRIKISNQWGSYGDRSFHKFWVQDKKLLNMVQLFMGKSIRHIESFALRKELPWAGQRSLFNEN